MRHATLTRRRAPLALLLALVALAPASVGAQAARYRVTLNGFTALRQTYDNPLQLDGKGDEIYFATYVAVIDTTARDLIEHSVVTSRAMGDVNGFPERVKMGMLSGRGGIRTGDKYPLPTPNRRMGPLAPDSLPMVLWEGELVQGERAVVLTPTVWEWDDNPELYGYWVASRGSLLQQLAEPEVLLSILNNRSQFPLDLGSPGFRVQTNMFADARDRPIGMELGAPATGIGFVDPKSKGAVSSGNGKGGSGGGASGIGGILGNLRQIVRMILSRSVASGLVPGFDRLADRFEPLVRSILAGGQAPGAKGRRQARTALPWDAGLGRAVLDALRTHLMAQQKDAANGIVRPRPLNALQSTMRAAIRDYRATELYFFEKTLVLTPEAMEAALQARPGPGKPAGAIDVSYSDHAPLQGRYVLHLQVERLP